MFKCSSSSLPLTKTGYLQILKKIIAILLDAKCSLIVVTINDIEHIFMCLLALFILLACFMVSFI